MDERYRYITKISRNLDLYKRKNKEMDDFSSSEEMSLHLIRHNKGISQERLSKLLGLDKGIEEDIKKLENLIVTLPNFHLGGGDSIERILQDYKRQKQINEEHRKINGELREKVKELEDKYILEKVAKEETEELLENTIPIFKIENEIKELKLSGGSNWVDTTENLAKELAIEILQELLQESEDK